MPLSQLEALIVRTLDDRKAEDILNINLTGKADFADRMIICSGTSARHVASLADYVVAALKALGLSQTTVEGKDACDWVLVDAGDIVVHIFRPEIRRHYNLEKMWSVPMPETPSRADLVLA
ncbi:MAG: ribosome silencing factor [Alphaproteobacteria bacterium]|nr:ribosome silencing factor [Alphaproteobacteria bacterium]